MRRRGHERDGCVNPDELESGAQGTEHDRICRVDSGAGVSEAELREALEKAFDYRGDVTITRKDGTTVEGYIFDRRTGATLAESVVRLFPQGSKR